MDIKALERIRRITSCENYKNKKECYNCEHYWIEKQWCILNDTDTQDDTYCDEFVNYWE